MHPPVLLSVLLWKNSITYREEMMRLLNDALKNINYDADPRLRAWGLSINTQCTEVDGRVLQSPMLKVGNGQDILPINGKWNFNNKKLIEPSKIDWRAVVNFSAPCDTRSLVRDLINCGELKGIAMEQPFDVFEENPSVRHFSPTVRVENMFKQIKKSLPKNPQFLLCLLQDKKNSDVYGPWKLKCLSDFGIVTQCIAPKGINDQYLTNVLLKINAKLGGMNSLLNVKYLPALSLISSRSIAAVVSSREWPQISRYRASVRTQDPKVEIIDSLFKRVSENEDKGIIGELLVDFYVSCGKRKPDNIIIFRDGVSESQYTQVLNVEMEKIIEACKFLDKDWSPKFTLIVTKKNHHTKFLDNVPPGTVVDSEVCHPQNFDFYMCPHVVTIGTTARPTHYTVLCDEIGFDVDDMQEFVHALSYINQRSTTAVSIVTPIIYARLAATQAKKLLKSSHRGVTSAGSIPFPELPRLHEEIRNSMFFC